MLGLHSVPMAELWAERDGEIADQVAKAIGSAFGRRARHGQGAGDRGENRLAASLCR